MSFNLHFHQLQFSDLTIKNHAFLHFVLVVDEIKKKKKLLSNIFICDFNKDVIATVWKHI